MKIIVIGCPGSGKSFLSNKISSILNTKVYHMDVLYWRRNWKHITRFHLKWNLFCITHKKNWIIDGNYSHTLEYRIKKANLIVVFDFPTEVCMKNAKSRVGKKRDDLPAYLEEKDDPEFYEIITNFKEKSYPYIETLIKKYPSKKVVILKTIDDENKFLNSLSTMLDQ